MTATGARGAPAASMDAVPGPVQNTGGWSLGGDSNS